MTGPWDCGDQVAPRPLAADAVTEVPCPAATPGTLPLWRAAPPLEAATPLRARPAHHVVPHRLGGQRHVTDNQAPSLAPTSPGPARLAAPGCVALMPRVVRDSDVSLSKANSATLECVCIFDVSTSDVD